MQPNRLGVGLVLAALGVAGAAQAADENGPLRAPAARAAAEHTEADQTRPGVYKSGPGGIRTSRGPAIGGGSGGPAPSGSPGNAGAGNPSGAGAGGSAGAGGAGGAGAGK